MGYIDLNREELLGVLTDIKKRVSELRENVSDTSLIDEVTNLYNRRLLYKTLKYEMKRKEIGYRFLSVLLLEINNLDYIEEIYGEKVSHDILKQVSELVLSTIRVVDIVGKYDKNKFMFILPDKNPNKGGVVAERIKKLIGLEVFPIHSEVTISVGVKSYEGESISELLDIVEINLNSNKKGYVGI